jgi:hypothetical protein
MFGLQWVLHKRSAAQEKEVEYDLPQLANSSQRIKSLLLRFVSSGADYDVLTFGNLMT